MANAADTGGVKLAVLNEELPLEALLQRLPKMREGVARWGERHPASIAPERQLACPTTLWPTRYVMGKAVIVSS
jgi:hypothetical protein